ncbi:hypothetical protein BDF22DRAFT_671968 [Syncephalis plumigaleata]|nr:hypothetical protein BDF22DRAFT_671968 [Syncephalis plumigaleata]
MVTLSEEEERNALPSADDRAELFQLRDILPAPEEYIRMGNGNVTEFRESEQKFNKLDGYVSPAALANRKDLLQNIAEKQSTFTATRGNKRCILQTPDGPPSANIIDSLVKKASLSLSINLSLGGSNGNNNLNALLPLIGKEGVERMKKQQSK